MAQIYNIISIVGFSLSGVFLICSVFFWFKFGILGIIGDLSGRTAKKSIAQMRADNEKNGRKKLATSLHTTKKEKQQGKVSGEKKEPIQEKKNEQHLIKNQDVGEATTMLNYGEGATEMLDAGTEVLDFDPAEVYRQQQALGIDMVQNIVLIHTQETI